MTGLVDHELRHALAAELHARPFPALGVPCEAALVAVKPPRKAAERDRGAERAHLLELLDRFGASHPPPGARHHATEIGASQLKWESHTEFTTYTIFDPRPAERPFDPAVFGLLPQEWLARAPGVRVTSALIRVEPLEDEATVRARLEAWFVPDSLAASRVLDGEAIVASDFRIDAAGHVRMAAFVRPGTGPRRVGRIVQRLCEIETYKTMSMLGHARVAQLGPRMAEADRELSALAGEMTAEGSRPEATLKALLDVSAELETMLAQSTFRFGATAAYAALVSQRVEVLREERFEGRQTLGEFMMRRFEPAMRTVRASERRLQSMAERAMRAAELLRTRVDVERSAQNQRLLESMDRRADLQLRLQHTVEGLSVVAISYYAVNLVRYLVYPLAPAGWSSGTVTAALTPPVVLAVWLMLRRVRRRFH